MCNLFIMLGMCKGMFLYRAVSSPLDRSKRFTLHPLADVFIPTSTRLLLEAFSHAAITVQRVFIHIFTTVYSQILIYSAERTEALWRERK